MPIKTVSFKTDGYVVVKNVLSRELTDFLSDYARFRARNNLRVLKNDSLAHVHREYGDPLMEMLLEKLTIAVEKATGIALWPTLSFYYTYKNGNQLLPHKDRGSCEIVAGLCIGADEKFIGTEGSWPLFLSINGHSIPIHLNYGDMVIFKGHSVEHWREPFKGNWFVSAIFGYVEKDGPFSYQKYDQRKALGAPHVGMFNWLYGSFKNTLKNKIAANFKTKE